MKIYITDIISMKYAPGSVDYEIVNQIDNKNVTARSNFEDITSMNFE